MSRWAWPHQRRGGATRPKLQSLHPGHTRWRWGDREGIERGASHALSSLALLRLPPILPSSPLRSSVLLPPPVLSGQLPLAICRPAIWYSGSQFGDSLRSVDAEWTRNPELGLSIFFIWKKKVSSDVSISTSVLSMYSWKKNPVWTGT
jgi:hypothetical protein